MEPSQISVLVTVWVFIGNRFCSSSVPKLNVHMKKYGKLVVKKKHLKMLL